jgi:serine phosphatase RsbU (regulator of sigma subunit)
MAVPTERLPLERLADAAAFIAATGDLREALASIADAVAAATGADVAVIRVVDADGRLPVRAIAPESSALGAEVAGTVAFVDAVAGGEPTAPTRRAAERVRAAGLLAVPARAGGRIVGSVELVRVLEPLGDDELAVASLAAGQLALAVGTLAPDAESVGVVVRGRRLELAGEALAAGGDGRRVAHHAVRLAVEITGARAGALWWVRGERPELAASVGQVEATLAAAAQLAADAVEHRRHAAATHESGVQITTLTLGQPPFGALQLFYPEDSTSAEADLEALAAFAARAAHALRTGERATELEGELDRTRALLEVVAEAISRLSLAHTLETAVDRIAERLHVDHVGVFLREEGGLLPAAGRGDVAANEDVAARLADAFRGPLRARGTIHAHVDGSEPALSSLRSALHSAKQRSVLAVQLTAHEESIGLLVVYPGQRNLGEGDASLVAALAAQLAVAVQNARLHERARASEAELTSVLESERLVSRRVNALYEISRTFTQTLSLERTLHAVTEALVRELNVDAAVIRMPDERGDQFVPQAVYVAESRLGPAVRAILERPQPRPPRAQEPMLIDAATAERLGGAHALLLPFLAKGSTAAIVPISTATELVAQLTILSLDPVVPISLETLATARTIGQQVALAIDNARLYQQQKQFAEMMQQSLLPRDLPDLPGLDVGAVYESAAQVDVGGDVFDFMELPDGRLAVVLGDVTGHGIDATGDMAMAKFVFRSLAREHQDPSSFLRAANEVVVSEIALGKFITMAYLTVSQDGELLCASAGHPEPRLVSPRGAVGGIACGGLALGIDAPQTYEQVRAELPVGGAVVLYTDGVIESRAERELFGIERLDAVLRANATAPAQDLANAVLAACREFAGGDLPDDCAVVVLRRT